MVLGHNLDKNLRKIEGLRQRGELQKALKQLQDWARRYPDSPHYQYEAAMLAFELKDYGVGLNSLKQLLRALPDSREKVLHACTERFAEQSALPLCEFLVENQLQDSDYNAALASIATLDADQLDVYERKIQLRLRSLSPNGEIKSDAAAACAWTLIGIAQARQDGEAFAQQASPLLEGRPKAAKPLIAIVQRALQDHKEPAWMHFILGRALATSGSVGQAASHLAKAGIGLRRLAEPALVDLRRLEPEEEEVGHYHYGIGRLALITRDGKTAAEHLLKAADFVPEIREELNAALARAEDPEDSEGLKAILKLRLRLLVVEGRFDDAQELIQRIRDEKICDPSELRSLLGEKQGPGEEKPSELMVLMCENSLRSGDLRAAAANLNNIPDHDSTSLRRVLNTLRTVIEEDEPAPILEWHALLAVLQSRVHDQQGASDTLAALWQDGSNDGAALIAITKNAADRVIPEPSLFLALLPYALSNGEEAFALEQLERMLHEREGQVDDVVNGLCSFIENDQQYAAGIGGLLDRCAKEGGWAQQLRYPTALAALHAGDYDRAVPEFSVLLMGSPVEREVILEHFQAALREHPDEPALQIAAYRVFKAESEHEDAMRCLTRALQSDPRMVGEMAGELEEELEKSQKDVELWRAYTQALFAARRFSQLDEACRRATETLPPEHSTYFRLLQAHVLVEEGKLSEGLTILAAQMQSPRIDRKQVAEILSAITTANPANSDAYLIKGENHAALGEIDAAIESYDMAARADRRTVRSVLSKLRDLAALSQTEGFHLVQIASFFRRAGQRPLAADFYERAMQMEESLAERVLADLELELVRDDCEPSFLILGAKAARRGQQLERACELLQTVNNHDDRQFEAVLSEFRRLQEDFPDEILPISYVARVLLSRGVTAAAMQILTDSAGNESYRLSDRIEMLENFHKGAQDEAQTSLLLAELYAKADRSHQAVTLLRSILDHDGIDLDRAERACALLHDAHRENVELGFLHFDLLQRLGRTAEAFLALPQPEYVETNHQSELSERFAPHARRVLADPVLAPRYATSLWRQGRTDDAITALQTAAEKIEGKDSEGIWTQLAQRLHEAGRIQQSREVLENLSRSLPNRRRYYELFSEWTQERLQVEGEALRVRCEHGPENAALVLDLAENLLEQGQAAKVPALLKEKLEDPSLMARRGVLLAKAHLDSGRCSVAENVLLQVTAAAADDRELFEDHQILLAECAGRLGRWGESHARYCELMDSPRVGRKARARAEHAYRNYLEDAAGNYRAVIYKVTDLADEQDSDQE
jgi:predicted Zn-dependent protease